LPMMMMMMMMMITSHTGPLGTRWVHAHTSTKERAVSLYMQYVTVLKKSPSCHMHAKTRPSNKPATIFGGYDPLVAGEDDDDDDDDDDDEV
jgi:hypothetical protein